jgi:drug/metabolite transporter (DMT)-like permease
MLWLVVTLISAVFYSLAAFLDNYIADVHFRRLDKSAIVSFALISSFIMSIVILFFFGFDALNLGTMPIILLIASGVSDIIGYILYFLSLRGEGATDVAVLQQFSPVFALILGLIFLYEDIQLTKIVAFLLILSAALIIIFGINKKTTKIGLKSGILMVIASAFWAGSNILFRIGAGDNDFFPSLFWLGIGTFVSVAFILAVKKRWRTDLKKYLKTGWVRKSSLNIANRLLTEIGNILQRYGFLFASVAIVSATKNVSFLIITFFLGLVLSRISPRFGREKLTKRSIFVHLIAVLLAAGGIAILNLI